MSQLKSDDCWRRKKNWLFFGSVSAGQNSAVIYRLIETCRKRNINPQDYLRDILTALYDHDQPYSEKLYSGKMERDLRKYVSGDAIDVYPAVA